jgi:tetratricopeptide (TPR) repeat protein
LKKERYEDAIACFDSSIEKGKDEAEAYRGKGVALYELEKYEEAANALESSLDKGSDPDAQICNLLALSYIGQEKYQESIAWLEKGIADESGSRELKQEMRYQLVFAYEKTSQWDKAKECAQQYLADFPDDQKMTREYQFLQTR